MNTNVNIFRQLRLLAVCFTAMLIATNVSFADKQFTESYDFEPGQTLSLDLKSGGSITIEGWDQSGIVVTYGDTYNELDKHEIDFRNDAEGLSINASLLKGINSSNYNINHHP